VLEIEGIQASYGAGLVLHGVSLDVKEDEVVCILGRNGVGKSTTLKAIMGLVTTRSGTITFRGDDITRKRTDRIAKRGIGYVPEDRDIFVNLTVLDNLKMAEIASRNPQREKALQYFPKLKDLLDHEGGSLSGGEQQMLAIARAVTGGADLMLLDEPSEGLAPVIREELMEVISELRKEVAILLVEQNLQMTLDLADRIYIMVSGAIAFTGTPEEMQESKAVEKYLML
jgi:branched-chain amino acid transport system ATP-binding protein